MPLSQLLKSPDSELQAELQLILNTVIEGVCGMDAAGNATFCNNALLQMTGYRAEELIGHKLHELLHHSRRDGTRFPAEECPLHKAADNLGAIHFADEFFWRKNGTCFPIEYWAHPLQRSSSLTAYVATIQDLTEAQQAKNVLRQSEEKFRRILASIPDVAWTADRHGRTTYISPKVEAMFGYSKQEICASGANLRLGCIHPEDFGRVIQSYRALFEKQHAFDEEYRIRRKDGSWIWIHDRAIGTHEENGVLYADGGFSDITRRKHAEAELQSQTAFLKAQADSTIDGILVVDGYGKRLLLNQRLLELFNVPPEIAANEDNQQLFEHVVTLIKDPESFLTKITYLNRHPGDTSRDEIGLRDGTTLDRYSSPVVGKSGIYYGRIWTFRDITERKRNEDTLQQLSMAVEQSPVTVIITDPQGKISYVNRKFTECTGYGPAEVLGKNPRMLKSGHFSPDHYRSLWSTITKGNEWHGEFCNRKKSGETYWESATIRPITDAGGTITHFLAIKEDITERRRAETELRRSQAYLAETQRLNHIGSWAWDVAKQEIVFWSEEHYRIFGMDPTKGTASFQKSQDRIHPEDLALVNRVVNESMCKKEDYETEFRIVLPDGSMRNIQSTGHPVVNEAGDLVEFVGTCMDVTERKRSQEELSRSRQMLQSILDAIPQRVFWKDWSSTYLGCNRALATDAGLDTPTAIIGKNDFDLVWNQMAEAYRADDKLVMEQGSAKLNFHERLKRPDGSLRWIQTNKLPLRDQDGRITGVIGTYEDITERKQAEKELRLAQFVIEHASDAIFRIAAQGQIVYVNQEACRSSERSREELLALTIPEIDPLFPQETWTAFWQDIKSQGSITLETVHETKQGRVFPVEVTANYLELDGEEFVFSFVRDITERNALSSQLRQAQKLESVGQLAAGIAHEINTPTQFVTDNLTFLSNSWKATQGLLEMYRSAIRNAAGILPPDVAAVLDKAERHCDLDFIVAEVPRAIDQSLDGANRVAKIVRAMKEFSHPDSADKTATDLNRAIQSTITVARNEWKYVAEIATEFDETLPPVVCYPGDINQVILNVLVNAAHAIKEKTKDGEMGRITVRTRVRGEFAEISVMDTGMGIPEIIRSRVFDPFFTTKEIGKGTGQGLSLAHTVVVKKHSGKIWFETEMGRGTTFFIDLPISQVNPTKGN